MIFSSSFSFCLRKAFSLSLQCTDRQTKIDTPHRGILLTNFKMVLCTLTCTVSAPHGTAPCSPWTFPTVSDSAGSASGSGSTDGGSPPPDSLSAELTAAQTERLSHPATSRFYTACSRWECCAFIRPCYSVQTVQRQEFLCARMGGGVGWGVHCCSASEPAVEEVSELDLTSV